MESPQLPVWWLAGLLPHRAKIQVVLYLAALLQVLVPVVLLVPHVWLVNMPAPHVLLLLLKQLKDLVLLVKWFQQVASVLLQFVVPWDQSLMSSTVVSVKKQLLLLAYLLQELLQVLAALPLVQFLAP